MFSFRDHVDNLCPLQEYLIINPPSSLTYWTITFPPLVIIVELGRVLDNSLFVDESLHSKSPLVLWSKAKAAIKIYTTEILSQMNNNEGTCYICYMMGLYVLHECHKFLYDLWKFQLLKFLKALPQLLNTNYQLSAILRSISYNEISCIPR